MPISQVLIKNYRSIREVRFSPGNVCVLVGENNSGKSNILNALQSFLVPDWINVRSFSEDDRRDKDHDNDIVIAVKFDPPLSHQPYSKSESVSVPVIKLTYTRYKVSTAQAQKGDPRLDVECLDEKGKQISVPQHAPRKGQKTKYGPLIGMPRDVRDQIRGIHIDTDRSLRSQMPTTRYSLLRRLLEDVDDVLTLTPAEGGKSRYDIFAEHLKKALDALRVQELEDLEKSLRRHALENLGLDPEKDEDRLGFQFGLFDSIDFLKALRLIFSEHGREFDATELGDGAQNALVIAIFQAYEELKKQGALFLIEEPEMYLHPHRQRYFNKTLRNISEKNQVFYTTHSPHFVSIPEYEEVHVVSRDEDGYTTVKTSGLPSTVELQEKLRKEFDPERNEFFFARQVILVEGDTEKLALPEYANRLNIDLNRLGCTIIEVGGKRNLLPMAEVVQSFDIPIILVFDRDSTVFKKNREKEKELNKEIRAFVGPRDRVTEFVPDYEGELRSEVGEEEYQRLCQKYPGTSKAIRARLIAADADVPVPQFVQNVFKPLTKKTQPKIDTEAKAIRYEGN